MTDNAARQRMIVAPLKAAALAMADGKLGERELIAISLAVNAELRQVQSSPSESAAFLAFSKKADDALISRVGELDRGEE